MRVSSTLRINSIDWGRVCWIFTRAHLSIRRIIIGTTLTIIAVGLIALINIYMRARGCR